MAGRQPGHRLGGVLRAARRCRMQRLAATLTAGSALDAGGGKRMAATGKGRDDRRQAAACASPRPPCTGSAAETNHPARPPPRPEDRPLLAMPPPRQPPPAARAGQTPSSSIRSTRPASLPTVSTGAPLYPHAALPEASAKDHGRAAPEPTRARCRRAPLPATGTRAKPARLPSMTPISPGTLTVSVADTRPASDARPAWRCSRCARPVGMFGELVG
jgi:hypothetical protein